MKNIDIARAWKDAEYRASLSTDELASLPENPAGTIELTDSELVEVSGGGVTAPIPCQSSYACTFVCGPAYTEAGHAQCTVRKPNTCWE